MTRHPYSGLFRRIALAFAFVVAGCTAKSEAEGQKTSAPSKVGTAPPHGGQLVEFRESNTLFVAEVKLHADTGHVELWTFTDRSCAKTQDFGLETVVSLEFPHLAGQIATFSLRDREKNMDQSGDANLRGRGTNYFAFPGANDEDPSWLAGAVDRRGALLRIEDRGRTFEAPAFDLRPAED